jgi:hypothetical protein
MILESLQLEFEMKTRWFSLFLFIMLISGLLIGCISGDRGAQSLVPSTLSPVPPSSSPTPVTPSPTPTLIPTDTPTPTAVLTLSVDKAYIRLTGLLNDGSCRLPCWLGIKPGQSTLQDVHEQLVMFSGITPSFMGLYIEPAGKWSTADLTISHSNDSMEIDIDPGYFVQSDTNIVSVVAFKTLSYQIKNGGRGEIIYHYPPYSELMKAYTLSAVLSEYGLPKQIYIYALNTSPLVYFQIHAWYPDKGIFMIYDLLAHDLGNSYQLCPTDSLVSGFLAQSYPADYQGFLLQMNKDLYKNFFPPSAFVKTTDEAFRLTSDQVYQLFRSPTTRCLETAKTVWPTVIGP